MERMELRGGCTELGLLGADARACGRVDAAAVEDAEDQSGSALGALSVSLWMLGGRGDYCARVRGLL